MPFVGREAELAALDTALGQAVYGEGGIVWLSGEAGIGKTRLVEEFSSLAYRRARVLFGSCREGDAARPYAPFAEALASYAREQDADELGEVFGPRSGLIARFVPELRERLPDISDPPELLPQEERFRLLDAVSRTLIAIARDCPLLLVLDDLHWADRGTVDMLLDLGRFAGENKLLIAGLYRGDGVSLPRTHPLRRCLAELPRSVSNYAEIALGNLERSSVSALLRSVDREISGELAEAICDYAGGNPFFVRETLSHVYGEGEPLNQGTKLGTTARASEVVRRRVSRLSSEAQNLLSVACAFEGTFDFDLIHAASGLESKQAADAIDESISAQILWPARGPEHYEFIHALVRDVLYGDLGPQNRVAQHRRIAKALEQLPEGRPERASEIAYQYGRCGSREDAERAIEHALAAADQAQAAYDYAQVGKFCQWARRIMGEHDERLPGLLRRLALAQAWALDPEAPTTTLEAGERTASSEGAEAAADFLAQAHVVLRDMGTTAQRRRPIITQGLRYNGDRRGPAWMSFTLLLSRDDPRSFSYTERSQDLELVEQIGEALSPEERVRYRFRGVFPRNRDHALRSTNPYDRVWYCGEYETSLEELRQDAQDREREARIPRAVDSWAFFARSCSALGRLREASDAIRRAAKLLERIPGARVSALQLDGARDDLRRARGYSIPERVLAYLELNLGASPDGSTDPGTQLERRPPASQSIEGCDLKRVRRVGHVPGRGLARVRGALVAERQRPERAHRTRCGWDRRKDP
jgi:tetratricopeptide (TPR) repeat protein